MAIDFLHPYWLLLLLPAAYAIFWWYRSERRLDGARKKGAALLRSLLFLLVILAVAGTALQAPVHPQETVFLIDESKSVQNPKDAVSWIKQAVEKKAADDGFAILGTGEKPAVEYPLALSDPQSIDLGSVNNPNYTNLAGGLRLAEGLFETGYKPRVVLLSDGEQNVGDAVTEARYLKERGVRVDVVPMKRDPGAELLVQSANVPSTIYQGETFNLGVALESTVATSAELRVYEDNREVAKTQVRVDKGESRFSIPLKGEQPGFHRYQVEVQAGQDTVSANNSAYAFAEVSGRPSVLIIEGHPGDAQWLSQALKAGQVPYEIKPVQAAPSRLEDLRRYAAIVIANASGVDIPEQTQKQIETAVRDFGVGLMMTGGQDSFGLGGYFNTPIEKALPVYMDIRSQKELPSLGLMLVIDRSGSMSGSKMELAKEAARRSAEMLSPQDTLGVVAFDEYPWWVIEPTHATDVKELQGAISGINAGGGTSIFPALVSAYDQLTKVQAKRKHIILLTDGMSAPGDYASLTEQMREKGITMSTVAVGNDADQALLRSLAEQAKGRFYATSDNSNVPQIFSKETAMAGKTYIQDQPFTPAVGQAKELAPLFEHGLPQINAQIATTAKETADVVLANPSPNAEPLLARWQYGLGRAVAWTSDAKGAWSMQWAGWDGAAAFWNQVMTWLLPQYKAGDLNVRAAIQAGQGQVEVKLQQPLPSGNALKAKVIGSDLSEQDVPLLLTSPGTYAGTFPTGKPGTYMVTVNEEQGGQVAATASTGVAVPYSPEYALPKNGGDTLARIAEAGGGQVLSDPQEAFADNLASKWQRHDISLRLLLIAAILWPFDVGLRRVRIPLDRLFSRWSARRARAPQPATAAAHSIEGLKVRTRSKMERPASAPKPPPISPTDRLTPPIPTQAPPPEPENSTVSRLLDKKRKK